MKSQQRNSNFELLRILSMLTIIGVHYIGSSNAFELIPPGTLSYELLYGIETIFNYGVNLFVLITGYHMIYKQSVSIRKALCLLLDVAIYGVSIYGISVLAGLQSFRVAGLIKSAVPLLAGYRWFIKAYIVLYLLIPFLNRVLTQLTQKEYLVMLGVFAVFFSLWPSFLPNPPLDDYGFSYQHFIFMYLIAGYLRRFVKQVKPGPCWAALITSFFATFLTCHLADVSLPLVSTLFGYKWAHNSPFNIIAVVAIFLLFSTLKLKSRAVNVLASSAFAVFLIHGDYNIMGYLFHDILHAQDFYGSLFWIPYFLLCITGIYIVCFVIDQGKQKLLNKPIEKLFDHISILNYEIKALIPSENKQ